MESHDENDQSPVDPFNSPSSISRHPCAACGWYAGAGLNPMKRHSPSSSTFSSRKHPEPKIMKLFLDQDEKYSKIYLPFPFGARSSVPSPARKSTQTHTHSPLRRTVSDPSDAIAIVNSVTSVTPSSDKATATVSALPPLPPGLRRTVSDPNPSSPAKPSPQSPTKADTGMESIKEESPDSKKLKRMTDRLREMNQRWNDVMREQEKEDESLIDNNGDTKESCEEESQETVEVERVEESLIVNFKCPCSKGYKILLSGENCFYKLV